MTTFGDEGSELTTPVVLKREIPWETYLTARLITDHDLQLIRRYDKRNTETQLDLLAEVCIRCSMQVQPLRLLGLGPVSQGVCTGMGATHSTALLCPLSHKS